MIIRWHSIILPQSYVKANLGFEFFYKRMQSYKGVQSKYRVVGSYCSIRSTEYSAKLFYYLKWKEDLIGYLCLWSFP